MLHHRGEAFKRRVATVNETARSVLIFHCLKLPRMVDLEWNPLF